MICLLDNYLLTFDLKAIGVSFELLKNVVFEVFVFESYEGRP